MKCDKIKIVGIIACIISFTLAGCGAAEEGNRAATDSSVKPQMLSLSQGSAPGKERSGDEGQDASSDNESMDGAQGGSSANGKRAVMLDGRLYVETEETNSMPRCGVMDGAITSTTGGELPTADNQSNFGDDIEYQYGMRKNRIEIPLDGKWRVFAYNENNLKNVTFCLTDVTAETGTLEISNGTDRELTYGEYFSVEKLDEQTGEWTPLQSRENIGFHDIAYVLEAGKTSTWQANWGIVYGTLPSGTYRLVQEVWTDGQGAEDFARDGKGSEYTIMTEFVIK